MKIKIITTGGTIDKVYFDAKSEFEVGDSLIAEVLKEALVGFDFEVIQLMRKDSLEITSKDRSIIRDAAAMAAETHILVTHGTDTMADTAKTLMDIPNKTIVFTGALNPARFRSTDAIFNIGFAMAALQTLPHGVYLAMNGQVFPAHKVRKNREMNRFEAL